MAKKRFHGVQGVRNYVSRVLVDLETQVAADVNEAAKLASAKFTGCRLMAELITSTALERRIKQLEKIEAVNMGRQMIAANPQPGGSVTQ